MRLIKLKIIRLIKENFIINIIMIFKMMSYHLWVIIIIIIIIIIILILMMMMMIIIMNNGQYRQINQNRAVVQIIR